MEREIEEQRNRVVQSENLAAEMQRKVFTNESEKEKDKALLEQKIEFLERSITELQVKESETSIEIKTQKKEHQTSTREMQTKYEH